MAEDVLKNCKKFVIQRIINPGVYWMTEYDNGTCYKRQLKEFEWLLTRSVVKVTEHDDIPVGMMVAVKDKTDFHRGIVTDVFKRKNETTYCIALVDYNKTIETTRQNVYFINNKKLNGNQFGTFEVRIHDIQPLVLDVDYKKNFESGIFQKRLCNTWSPAAFIFVRDMVKKHPYVFVKALQGNQRKILGEIYFFDKKLMSLGQLLSDKGFAVLSSTKLKLQDDMEGRDDIEGKIPKNALFSGVQESESEKSVCNDKNETESLNESVQRVPEVQSRSVQTATGCGNSKSCNASENCYSSWMLRKCLQLYALNHSSGDSLKK